MEKGYKIIRKAFDKKLLDVISEPRVAITFIIKLNKK